MPTLVDHRSRGARALILLHDQELRSFLDTWRQAKTDGLSLPTCEDPSYASFDALGWHVLACARHYMVWCCEVLKLAEPGIDVCPPIEVIDAEAERYLEHVLERWTTPLADVADDLLEIAHTSRWGVEYCVDAMLEHAVMHPVRHAFQLRELMPNS
jgi:hypothetical protein